MGAQASSFAASQATAPAPPGQEQTTWWCRLLAKAVGCLGGGLALILGIWTCVSIKVACIIAGILQMIFAVVVLVFEAPICCTWLEATKPIASFAERRTYFQKAIIFGVMAIIPIALCFGISTLFGSGVVFAAGVIYGLMALGRKADRETMAAQAQAEGGIQSVPTNEDPEAGLVYNEKPLQ